MSSHRVLFVCTGNICRSPTAEAVARGLADVLGLAERFEFDSAGIQGYHVGEPPDPRTVKAARQRGYDLSPLRARRVTDFDFLRFDLLLAMGQDHLQWLQRACPSAQRHKLRLFLDFSERYTAQEVPDPYYGCIDGFELVLDMVEEAAGRLIAELKAK